MTKKETSTIPAAAAAPPGAPGSGKESSATRLETRLGAHAVKAGYTAVPDVLIRSHKQLKISRTDLLVTLVLMTYWRSVDDMPWPSKDTIATALDMDPETVRRSVKKMEGLGYIKRVMRKTAQKDNMTNKYDLSGLARAVNKLAKEQLELKAARAAEDKATISTPASAKLKLVKGSKAAEAP